MHFQTRGHQSRPKNDHHTVWEREPDMPNWAWAIVPLFLIGLWLLSL